MNKLHKYMNVFLIAAAFLGITLELIVADGLHNSLNLFSYYTIQSNLIVIILLGLYLFVTTERQKGLHKWLTGVTSWILITGVVYHIMLSATHDPVGIGKLANLLLHYVTPVGMFLNWLLLSRKKLLSLKNSLVVLVYPVIYFAGSLIRGYHTGFYPYWFINPVDKAPDGIGSYAAMFQTVGFLLVVFMIVGFLMVLVNNIIVKREISNVKFSK
ncbi:MAG: Pr6Pr family membrane protein [Halanaerobiales bacterium]